MSYTIDAKDYTLGRLASIAASVLQGKHRPDYEPNLSGSEVVVIQNTRLIKVTGRKETDKIYIHHSNHPGGLHRETYTSVFAKNPATVVHRAVFGMLPNNHLRRSRLKRLIIKL